MAKTESNLSADQLARLPQKVRDEITRLCRNVDYWQERATAGPDQSDTFAHRGYDQQAGQILQPLGTGTTIVWQLDTDRDTRIEARLADGEIKIMSVARTTRDMLVIEPQASNVFKIRVIERPAS